MVLRATVIVASVSAMLLSAGCSREHREWRAAETADTIEAYDRFIANHRDSELATEARARLIQLTEERDWLRANSADTAASYRKFLQQHPEGKWSQEARIRVETFALDAPGGRLQQPLPNRVVAIVPTEPSIAPPLARPIASPPYIRPTPSPPFQSGGSLPTSSKLEGGPMYGGGLNGFGIQLGAFSSEQRAREEWLRVSARFPQQLRALTPHVIPATSASGPLFRLQAAVPNGEASARLTCDSLKKQFQGCVVVLPPGT